MSPHREALALPQLHLPEVAEVATNMGHTRNGHMTTRSSMWGMTIGLRAMTIGRTVTREEEAEVAGAVEAFAVDEVREAGEVEATANMTEISKTLANMGRQLPDNDDLTRMNDFKQNDEDEGLDADENDESSMPEIRRGAIRSINPFAAIDLAVYAILAKSFGDPLHFDASDVPK